jgi:hypothetical protein
MGFQVAFPLIGGPHQVFHTAPVAAALAGLDPDCEVTILASDDHVLRVAQYAVRQFDPAPISFELMKRSSLGDRLATLTNRSALAKRPLLSQNKRRLGTFDALVVPECTSVGLRQMGVTKPQFICLPHGAGDRAVSFETRFRQFDLVLVAGRKTADRMIGGGVAADRIQIVGYPKTELIQRIGIKLRLFRNDRPTVLYNPHFRASLSSLGRARQVVSAFAARSDFNLIVAPHVRSFEDCSGRELREWASLETPDQILVDLGSDRLIDMAYTEVAHIYLGDVSSQVYEFLQRPRPCVFLNAHGVKWGGNPDYAFWSLGEVTTPDLVWGATSRAQAEHGKYLDRQVRAVNATFANIDNPARSAASEILRHLERDRFRRSSILPIASARQANHAMVGA